MTFRDLVLVLLLAALGCAIGAPDSAHDVLRDIHDAVVRRVAQIVLSMP